MTPDPKVICITGASSGIGAALAESFSAPGISLLLIARNEQRLQHVAKACERLGARVVAAAIDVTERDRLRDWLVEQDQKTPIDLVIANAGLSMHQAQQPGIDVETAENQLIDVHLKGTLNTLYPILSRMKQRQQGQIAIMSSLNGFIVLGRSRIYGAVKSALMFYGLSLRATLSRKHIAVSVICPGWVRSRLTDANRFAMPLKLEAPRAAAKIISGLKKNKAIIAFPWPVVALLMIAIRLPLCLRQLITKKT